MEPVNQGEMQASTLPDGDVVRILMEQHVKIKQLLTQIHGAQGSERQQLFDELRGMLAVHETAEEMILRPVTRTTAGEAVADARMAEESRANEVLAHLDGMDATSPEFDDTFASFEQMVLNHATNEEQQEFPTIEAGRDPEELQRLGRTLLRVEKAAPTHPHPSAAGSTAMQWAAGPFASIVDRARDAVHRAMQGDGDGSGETGTGFTSVQQSGSSPATGIPGAGSAPHMSA